MKMKDFSIIYSLWLMGAAALPVLGQSHAGRFCLQYYPQPLVEVYVDSLVSYLARELGEEQALDETTMEYIEHFASLMTRKSKCVYFRGDTVLIHELVDDQLVNSYMILKAEARLVSRTDRGLVEQDYFVEPDEEEGRFDYAVRSNKGDTKLIEGFLCYRLDLEELYYPPGGADPVGKSYVLYVTDDLPVPGGFVLGNNMSLMIGCPLEIHEPLNTKVNIVYRARGFRLAVPAGIFQTL